MAEILYAFSNIVHIYAVYVFLNTILGESKFGRKIEFLSFGVYFIINTSMHLIFGNLAINLITNTVPLFIISFQYKFSTIRAKFFSVFSICAVAMFIDLFVFSIFGDIYLVKNGIIQCIGLLIFAFVFRTIYKTKKLSSYKSAHIWLLILISIGTIAIGQLTISEFNLKSLILSIILLIINFLNFYTYDKVIENAEVQQTLKLVETSNLAYQNQLEILNENQKKIRLLRHDMKNHLFKIKNCVKTENYNELDSYIDSIHEYMNVEKQYVSTGNFEVDCLLNYKLAKAERLGINFTYDVALPEDLIVSSFDLTVILGNILDNCLNALSGVNDKVLNIEIRYTKGMIKINTENTFDSITKKSQREGDHGLGLISIQQAIEKYHGVLKTSSGKNTYYVSVTLYNSLN